MTRSEAFAEIIKVNRRCRGPFILNEEQRRELHKLWLDAMDSGDFHKAMAMKLAIENGMGLPNKEIAEDDWDNLLRRVAGMIFMCRENCNYDVNKTIVAGPLDGTEVKFNCPNCGTEIIYSADYGVV